MSEELRQGVRQHLEAKRRGLSVEEYQRRLAWRQERVDFIQRHPALPLVLEATEELAAEHPDVVVTVSKAEEFDDPVWLRLSWGASVGEDGAATWNEVSFEPRVEYDGNLYYLLVHSGIDPHLMDPDNFQLHGVQLPEPFRASMERAILDGIVKPAVKSESSTPDPFGLGTRTVLFGGTSSMQPAA